MKTTKRILAAVVVGMLAGCGGGSSNTRPSAGMMDMPDVPSGATDPVRVALAGSNIDSIHLETTDPVMVVSGSGVQDRYTGAIFAQSRRDEVVCPGIAPRGNECTVQNVFIDGGERRPVTNKSEADFSIGIHRDYLAAASLSLRRIISDSGHWLWQGGVGEGDVRLVPQTHSAFYVTERVVSGVGVTGYISWAAAFGNLHSDYPAEKGAATWQGAMVGMQRAPNLRVTGAVEGEAILRYDFSANQVDLNLFEIVAGEGEPAYGGPGSLRWQDLQVNSDGSFYIRGHGNDKAGTDLHPEHGYVDGDFFGPGGEEFAGVFETVPYAVGETPGYSLVGGFGGSRWPDEDE